MRTTRQHTIATRGLLLTLLLAGSVAACGGGGGDDQQVASLGTDTTAADDSSSGDGEVTDQEREDAMLAYTECMRDHGVDMPDPQTSAEGGANGPIVIKGERADGAPDGNDEFEEANDACKDLIEDVVGEAPQMDPEEQAKMQDNALAYAQCMRDHSIDFPDPDFSDGGMAMMLPEGMDPQDPDFAAAEEECQPELGFEDGKGPTTHIEGSGRANSSAFGSSS